jgi:diguanylate cyclase (GGDEF)-like protein/PAS domain S-box-containing protein
MQPESRAFKALHEVAVAASGLRDPAALADLVVNRARDLLAGDAADLYWWFPDAGELRTISHNDPQASDPEPPFAPGQGAAGKAFRDGRPVRVDEYPGWPDALAVVIERGIVSVLAVPLLVTHRPVGAIAVYTRERRHWSEADEALLTMFAAEVAPAMEAARLSEETVRQANNFRALHEIAVAAGGLRDMRELGDLVVDRTRQLLRCETATICCWDDELGRLRVLASAESDADSADMVVESEAGVLAQAYLIREPVQVENYAESGMALEWGAQQGIRSAAAVPVLAGERPLGSIGVATTADRRFSRDDVQLLTLLAAQIGPALENARLLSESERRRREAEALAELVRRGATLKDVDDVSSMIGAQARKLVGADAARVVLREGAGRSHRSRRAPAELALPLVTGVGDDLGELVLSWRSRVTPAPAQVHLAEAVASYAATIIDNARTHVRERQLASNAAAGRAELAAIIENIPDGVYVVDTDGEVRLLNRAGAAILRVDAGSTPLPRPDQLKLREPVTRRQIAARRRVVSRALRGETVISDQSILSLAGGRDVWLESSAVPLLDGQGRVTGAVIVFSDVTRERKLVHELADSEARFRSLYSMVACGVLVQDAEGNVVEANRYAEEILGWRAEEIRGKRTGNLWQAFTEDGVEVATDNRPAGIALRTGQEARGTVIGIRRRDRQVRWVQVDTIPVLDDSGRPRQVVSSFIDITERKRTEERLLESERKLRAIFDHAPIGLCRVDLGGTIQETNLSLQSMLRYSAGELAGRSFMELLDLDGEPGFADLVAGRRERLLTERRVVRRDEREVWASISLELVRGAAGEPLYLIGMVEDVTDRKAQTELLEYQAMHDALTDLPNRMLLTDRLQQAVLTAQREDRRLALLLLDLNGFKDVNDTFGHHLGDRLLQQVGSRIQDQLRESDTVARLGGDEFAVVLPTADDEQGAGNAARRILKSLEEPFVLEDRRLQIGGSIGIALTPDHGHDPAALLRRADIAMYVAKRTRTGYAVYKPEQDQHSPARLALIAELREAIPGGQLVLHFQPQVRLSDGRVQAVEALVRWQHPRHGLMLPDQFIELAEETGLIVSLTDWALQRALIQMQAWWAHGQELAVAVNVSAQCLRDPTLPATLRKLLATFEGDPRLLKLEISETALMADPTSSTELLNELRQIGVRISIDDFGTGYSSLAYLKQLPLDELKIDNSYVVGITADSEEVTIIRSTVELGHSLGLAVVAEGVETEAAREVLRDLGCDYGQGFYLARPMAQKQLTRWLVGRSEAAVTAS